MQILKIFTCALLSSILFGLSPMIAQTQQDVDMNASTRVVITGTPVSLFVPNVFQFDETQSAYIYSGASASIHVQFLEGKSLSLVVDGFGRSNPEKQGMEVVSEEDLKTTAGMKAKLITCSMNATSSSEPDTQVEFIRLIFIAGDATNSVYITVNYPKITEKLLAEPLRSSLISVEF